MNTGIFGEGFPYSNFHDLNMDWIIKIAKDFLDQYTHIQEIIEQGKEDIETLTESGITQIGDLTATSLQDLQDKADALEALLQEWYNEHSEDIAEQLADAIADLNDWYTTHQNYLDQTLTEKEAQFDAHADQKAANTIASIPDDYTTLANAVAHIIQESDIVGNMINNGVVKREVTLSGTGTDTFGITPGPYEDTFYFENTGNANITLSIFGSSASLYLLSDYVLEPGDHIYFFYGTNTSIGIKAVWAGSTKLKAISCTSKLSPNMLNMITRDLYQTKFVRTITSAGNYATTPSRDYGILKFVNSGANNIILNIFGASASQYIRESQFIEPGESFTYYYPVPISGTTGIKVQGTNPVLNIYELTPALVETPLKGKTIYTYGDSLVHLGVWQGIIAQSGATVINSGIPGSTLAYRNKQQYVNSYGRYVGDPDEGYVPQPTDILINDTGSGTQRMAFIPADCDIVLVLFGTNDYHQNKPMGDYDSDNTYFKGAISTFISWMRTNRPNTKIIFMTPTIERVDTPNTQNLKKIDYVKAILESELILNNDIINLWSLTSWGIENISEYTRDDIHWNDVGLNIVGNIALGYLLTEYPFSK